MSTWGWILIAAAACFALKYAGSVVPDRVLTNRRFAHVAGMITVGLLAAMVAMQTFAGDDGLVLDARLAALAAAAVALLCRCPFIVVVLIGAVVAAGVRAVGIG